MNLYGLFFSISTLLGIVLFFYLAKKSKLPNKQLIENIFWIFLGGFLGARITYIILYSNQFATFYDLIAVWQGGFVSFGGMIGGFLVAFYFFRKQNFYLWLDLLSTSFFFGWIFGRLGGFLTANALGKLNSNFGPLFYNRVPIQLFESLLAILIVLISWKLISQAKTKHGVIFSLNLMIYTFGRFIIDFWREDKKILFSLSLGQIFSLLLILCAILLLINRLKSLKRYEIKQ